MRPLALTLALAALVACTHPRTQIILLVETDMPQGPAATLTHVRITVGTPASPAPRQRLTYPLGVPFDGGAGHALPATLGIAALDNDGSRSVAVRVEAVNDPGGSGTERGAMFTYTAVAPFEDERTLLLRVFLADRCRAPANQMCPQGFTCGRDGCEPERRTSLPAVPPDFLPDAGAADVAAPDLAEAAADAAPDSTDVPDDLDAADVTDAPDALDALDGADDAADGAPDAPPDVACPEGQSRCGDGCVDTRTSTAHCGACGAACPARANATARCEAGRCASDCAQGFADCDADPANGCESDLRTDVRHCGSCAVACSNAGATPACSGGMCRVTCRAGFGDCDGDASNGCEANLGTADDCGACGSACRLPDTATAACVAGACAVDTCPAGRADCDRASANGCEVDIRNDGANCNGCGRVCPSGQRCNAGVCSSTCGTGLTACGTACVNTSTNPAHCGGCGRPCPARPNAVATCAPVMGVATCGFACNAGFADCNGAAADGCETALDQPATCGACTNRCAFANASASCTSGSCQLGVCAAGFGNCDGVTMNGCETALQSSPSHCGGCGVRCDLPRATASCVGGACAVGACNAGFGDCDRVAINGCETPLNAPSDCGACGRACNLANATAACDASGACAVAACAPGFGNCDGSPANGCEVNLTTDPAHCMRCGNRCPAGQVCSGGACTPACGPAEANCGGRCVNTAGDVAHCGRCGNACPPRANATATCALGLCGFACNAGFGSCDGDATNGCETRLDTLMHCGACGQTCSPPHATGDCSSGSCRVGRCAEGYVDCDGNPANGCELMEGAVCPLDGGCTRSYEACVGGRVACVPGEPLPCGTRCATGTCDGFGTCRPGPGACVEDGGVVVLDGGLTLDGALGPEAGLGRDGGGVLALD